MERTPRKSSTKGNTKAPKSPMTSSMKATSSSKNGNSFSFTSLAGQQQARLLRSDKIIIDSFKGLFNFPNLRILDLKCHFEIPIISYLVAFRSLNLQRINGIDVTDEDIIHSFQYSGLVTLALREGMHPILPDDPKLALENALKFLKQPKEPLYEIENNTIMINEKIQGDVYTWSVLDNDFNWKVLDNKSSYITTDMNYPIRCLIKSTKGASYTILVPEIDENYHIYGEISGNQVEDGLLTVTTNLSSQIEWRHLDDEELINSGTLVLPLSADDIDRVIVCDITPLGHENLPSTRLYTQPISAGEFRFKSVRMHGQLVEGDSIDFQISTHGTKATFKGIRILRSAQHGEWENVDFIQKTDDDQGLKYSLTVKDIGCVIRAVCVTEGGGPPLMLTSSERVLPSAPKFSNANIFGSMHVGMPLFAIAEYSGGIQGTCRYEWSIGGSKTKPIIVPQEEHVGQIITCKMIPIRSDGSIGKAVTVSSAEIQPIDNSVQAMEERYLQFHKKTRSGKLQMSFVDHPSSELFFTIHEGDTLIISIPCDWAVITQQGIKNVGNSKVFTATANHINGYVVVFSEDFYAIVGQVTASEPTASDVTIHCDNSTSFLKVSYKYSGGEQGRSIIQWNKVDKRGETVCAFSKSYHVGVSDINSSFKAYVTPVSLDGRHGKQVASALFKITEECVASDMKPKREIGAPDLVLQDTPIKIVTIDSEIDNYENNSEVLVSKEITKREKVEWVYKKRIVAEGLEFIPTIDDIGKVFTCQIRDRIRNAITCSIDLPPVEAQPPSISDVKLIIEDIPKSKKKRISVSGRFYGGHEGESIIIWKAQKPNDETPLEVARTTKKWVEIDETFEGAKIGVDYIPYNIESKKPGKPCSSLMTLIQKSNREPIITILSAEIVPDKDYENLMCKVETTGPGELEFNWGYIVNGEKQYTNDITASRPISDDDFRHAVICLVQPVGPDGELGEKIIVELKTELPQLLQPIVNEAKIIPINGPIQTGRQSGIPEPKPIKSLRKSSLLTEKHSEITMCQGIEVEVKIDYNGPQIIDKKIIWQRQINKSEWKSIFEGETYLTNSNDLNHPLRAVGFIYVQADYMEQPIELEFESLPLLISQKNTTIVKMAGSIVRTKKGSFDVVLATEEDGIVVIDNEQLTLKLKKGSSVLLKVPLKQTEIEVEDGSVNTVALKARHGYNTELSFGGMTNKSGVKFTPNQVRDLFIETYSQFRN